MSMLPPATEPSIFWVDDAGQQQGPELLDTLVERLVYQQIPTSTLVWWPGATGWLPFDQYPELQRALDLRRSVPAGNVYAASPLDAAAPAAAASTADGEDVPLLEMPTTTSPDDIPFAPQAAPETAAEAVTGAVSEDMAAAAPEDVAEVVSTGSTLDLGDPDARAEARAEMTRSADDFHANQEWVASLSGALASLVANTATRIGLTVEDVTLSNGYHIIRTTAGDRTPVTISVEDAPGGTTADDRLGRPLACFVDQSSRAHGEVCFGDYLRHGDEPDVDGLHLPLAALVEESLHGA